MSDNTQDNYDVCLTWMNEVIDFMYNDNPHKENIRDMTCNIFTLLFFNEDTLSTTEYQELVCSCILISDSWWSDINISTSDLCYMSYDIYSVKHHSNFTIDMFIKLINKYNYRFLK